MQTIILLLFIWIFMLTPYIWRRVNEFRIDSQIGKYGSAIGSITKNSRHMNGNRFPTYRQNTYNKIHPDSNVFYLQTDNYTEDAAQPFAQDQTEKQQPRYSADRQKSIDVKYKKRLVISRRRRNIKILFSSILFTLVFGIIPVFNFLWYLCIALTILTASYMSLLYYINNLSDQYLITGRDNSYRTSAHNIGMPNIQNISDSGLRVDEIKRKPSFTIVEDPEMQRAMP